MFCAPETFPSNQGSQQSGGPAGPCGGTSKSPGQDGRVGDGGRPPGTTRVMSHDGKRILLEVHDINLGSTGGPSARTIVPYSPFSPHLPESSA